MRKDLFGEQAFLPLTVDGALLADDHVALAANIWQALPDDLGKRAVVHYDPSRMANPVRISSDSVVSNNPVKSGFISFSCLSSHTVAFGLHRLLQIRALWYVVTDAIVRRKASIQAFVFVFNFRNVRTIHDLNESLLDRIVRVLLDILPVKVKALHICGPADPALLKHVAATLKPKLGKELRRRLVLHRGQNLRDVADSLQEFGLVADGLPSSIGGSFGCPDDHKPPMNTTAVCPPKNTPAQAA